ncbi:11635_t:CDS:1, partial [Racocetra fulgida]
MYCFLRHTRYSLALSKIYLPTSRQFVFSFNKTSNKLSFSSAAENIDQALVNLEAHLEECVYKDKVSKFKELLTIQNQYLVLKKDNELIQKDNKLIQKDNELIQKVADLKDILRKQDKDFALFATKA